MSRIRKLAMSERGIMEPVLSEEDVLGQIRQLLEVNGARIFRVIERIPWGKTKSEGGIPDLFGWWPKDTVLTKIEASPTGYVFTGCLLRQSLNFFIEVKKPGGKLRPSQIRWIEQARSEGVIVFFADSVDAMVARFKEFGIVIKGVQ